SGDRGRLAKAQAAVYETRFCDERVVMAESPRIRRLRADRRALEQLKSESSVFDFAARGELPDSYALFFRGRGVWRADQASPVQVAERHEVHLRLGAAYPRMMPELTWRSPIFHPNISA